MIVLRDRCSEDVWVQRPQALRAPACLTRPGPAPGRPVLPTGGSGRLGPASLGSGQC